METKETIPQVRRINIEFTREDLRRLIVPLVIEQLLAITVGLFDSVMVSHVGEAAISAVSLVDTVNVLLVNAFAALATGGAVIAGQYLGRREPEKAGHSGQQLLLFMGEASLLIMVLFYLAKGFVLGVVFGQVEPDVAAYANTYYIIVEASIPFLALYSAGAALFRVMGNSKISMWVSLLMNVINVAGNASAQAFDASGRLVGQTTGQDLLHLTTTGHQGFTIVRVTTASGAVVVKKF